MTAKYPDSIDEVQEKTNNLSEVLAEDHNNLRDAVIAIKEELGLNPSGPFGTVMARLDDAYNNIEYHVHGNPPRHMDSVIMSPERTGALPTSLDTPPFDLSAGTLADQISSLLNYIHDTLMYGGSGSTTFADGTSLSLSLVRNAITEIINQLGGTDGSDKIGVEQLYVTGPFGVSGPPTNTSIRDQLLGLLSLIDAFGKYTGAGLVGTTGFTSSTGGRYIFSDGYVQGRLEELGNHLDEGANFREKAFNAFVVEGCAVSNSSGNANIASGFVAANGRTVSVDSYNNLPITDGSTSYVYVEVSGGTASINASTSLPTRAENPVVLLHKIVRSGVNWTTDTDIRRFGLFVNDKNYISVGNKPASGKDGYGCDFTSLKSAVEYAKVLNSGNELIPPLKIILASDISITSSSEMEIILNVEGMQIDGCGRKITTNQDYALFKINEDNITIKDLTLESNLSSSGSALCLAQVGENTNVNGITITSCRLQKTGSYPAPYFLRLSNTGATTSVSNSVFSENIVEVEKGGIEYYSTNKYAQVLKNSVVLGNNIYQNSFLTTSYAGIKASQRCTIGDNIIKGGFSAGILLAAPTQCRVDGNLIIGAQASSIYMTTGIEMWNSAAGQDNGSIISDNTIKGVNNFGINCRAGTGSGAYIAIFGNFIDNYYSDQSTSWTPPSTMVAIKGRGSETWVVGNKITAPGYHGIENCSHAISNQIYGHPSVIGTTSAIEMAASTEGVVANNTIFNVSGKGIDINENEGIIISGNSLIASSATTSSGIDFIGHDCIVSNNLIKDYNSTAIRAYTDGDRLVITNNKIIDCGDNGIELSNSYETIVSGNWMRCPIGVGGSGIKAVGARSIVSNNFIANYGYELGSAIFLYYSSSNRDTIICGNVINNLHADTKKAIWAKFGGRVSVIGNIIDNCPGIGVFFDGTSQVLCANNIISGDSISTYAVSEVGSNSIISGNVIDTYCTSAGNAAIHLSASSDNVSVINNHMVNCEAIGVDVNSSYNSTISGNYIECGTATSSGDHAIKNVGIVCIVSGNRIWNACDDGIDLVGDLSICCNNAVIGGNIGIHGTGQSLISFNSIQVPLSEGIKCEDLSLIIGNFIANGSSEGIYLIGASNSIVNSNFVITCDGDGVNMESSDECSVMNNFISELASGNGISVNANSNKVIIGGNKINNVSDYGIELYGDDSSVTGNIIEDSNIAIYLSGATDALVNGNKIINSNTGINITFSVGVLVTSNWIGSNTRAIDTNFIIGTDPKYLFVGNLCTSPILPSGWSDLPDAGEVTNTNRRKV